jgi:hypothetical protein
MPILLCLLYLVLHAGLYFVILRNRPAVASEKGIFRYHLASAVAVTGVVALWALVAGDPEAWTWFVAVIMLHGIYSLSFLELWALADDSYSVAIMELVGRNDGVALVQRFEEIGISKQTSRLDALQALGLVGPLADGSFALTSKGRAAAIVGRAVLFLVNVRKFG